MSSYSWVQRSAVEAHEAVLGIWPETSIAYTLSTHFHSPTTMERASGKGGSTRSLLLISERLAGYYFVILARALRCTDRTSRGAPLRWDSPRGAGSERPPVSA
jgi:hypothetical protein